MRAARWIYADIGTQLGRRGFDFRAGRVVVPRLRKLRFALRALLGIRRPPRRPAGGEQPS